MMQCSVNREFMPTFTENNIPRLVYSFNISANYNNHPRIMHCHNDYLEILLIRSGTGIYVVEGKQYQIKRGDIIICNSGVMHDEIPEKTENINTYCLAISNVKINKLGLNALIPSGVSPVLSCGDQFEDIENLMGIIYKQLRSGKKNVEETCHYMTLTILTIVLSLIDENNLQEIQLRNDENTSISGSNIKKYIDNHYNEDLNLQILGEKLNMSPYYLSHVFKKATGYSPMKYIQRRRIGEAQTYLIHTNWPVTLISSIVGYGNYNYFNSLFTEYVKITPIKYRRIFTSGETEKVIKAKIAIDN